MSDKGKETFEKNFKKYFSEYLDQSKLEKRIPSYKYLNDELHKLEADCTESSYKKVMQKKILLKSENAKKFCRNGIPLKYLKDFIKKLFYVDFSKNDYENKKLEVLKGKDISLFNENIPYFTNKSFEESVPVNFLNEKGIEALKEICCLLSNVLQRIEYSPLIIKLSSLLLIFFTKEETYEIMRNLIELSNNSFEIENIRWHFRFNQEGNMKIVYSITQSILTLSDNETITRFKALNELGCEREHLIKDMSESLFLTYLNFIGVIRFLPIFLYEGTKAIYRLCFGLVRMIQYKIVEKKSEKEIIEVYKNLSFKIENIYYLFDLMFKWNLTHSNNGYTSTIIPRLIKDEFPKINNHYYVPIFTPQSNILTPEDVIQIWNNFPDSLKMNDATLIFDKISNPESDLMGVYNICEKLEDLDNILFIVQTDKDDIFGGIMNNNLQITKNGECIIPGTAVLFGITPKFQIYSKEKTAREIALCEPGCLRFGKGEDGFAISIDHDLKVGWTEKNSVFGENIELLGNYDNDGEFNIKNFEIYLMM